MRRPDGKTSLRGTARAVPMVAVLLGFASGGASAEVCWTEGSAQFYSALHYCVSSRLPPQGGWTYGPRNLSRADDGGQAWCEGVDGHGIGETMTLRIEGGSAFRRILIANGYGKSRDAYEANGRVAELEITSDTGMHTRVRIVDQNPVVPVYLPYPAEHKWLRLRILDVHPGTRYRDTCVDFVGPDFEHEEMLLQRSQGGATDD